VVGRELLKEAPFAPLASTYMFLGEKVNGTLRTSEAARGFAARRFPELLAEPLDLDKVSVARFTAAQSLGGKLAYYGAPILLVLSFVLHVLRQKRIRSFGGVD
jgi:hypothetical protein